MMNAGKRSVKMVFYVLLCVVMLLPPMNAAKGEASAPTLGRVTAQMTLPGSVELSWQDPHSDVETQYLIYAKKGDSFAYYEKTVTQCMATLTNLTMNTRYTFIVEKVSAQGRATYEEVSIQTPNQAPAITSVQWQGEKVNLHFSMVQGASLYHMYQASAPNGPFVCIGSKKTLLYKPQESFEVQGVQADTAYFCVAAQIGNTLLQSAPIKSEREQAQTLLKAITVSFTEVELHFDPTFSQSELFFAEEDGVFRPAVSLRSEGKAVISDLLPGMKYTFALAQRQGSTLQLLGTCEAVTPAFRAQSRVMEDKVHISWTDLGNAQSYRVDVQEDPTMNMQTQASEVLLEGLVPQKTYHVTVTAELYDREVSSEPLTVIGADPPPVAGSLAIEEITSSVVMFDTINITLTWAGTADQVIIFCKNQSNQFVELTRSSQKKVTMEGFFGQSNYTFMIQDAQEPTVRSDPSTCATQAEASSYLLEAPVLKCNEMTDPTKITLSWAGSFGAFTYAIMRQVGGGWVLDHQVSHDEFASAQSSTFSAPEEDSRWAVIALGRFGTLADSLLSNIVEIKAVTSKASLSLRASAKQMSSFILTGASSTYVSWQSQPSCTSYLIMVSHKDVFLPIAVLNDTHYTFSSPLKGDTQVKVAGLTGAMPNNAQVVCLSNIQKLSPQAQDTLAVPFTQSSLGSQGMLINYQNAPCDLEVYIHQEGTLFYPAGRGSAGSSSIRLDGLIPGSTISAYLAKADEPNLKTAEQMLTLPNGLPVDLKAENQPEGIALSWTPKEPFSCYEIYIATEPTGFYSYAGRSITSTFLIKDIWPNTAYSIRVAACENDRTLRLPLASVTLTTGDLANAHGILLLSHESLGIAPSEKATLSVQRRIAGKTLSVPSDDVTWVSSDHRVVMVYGGIVYAIGEGSALVQARYGDELASCWVDVHSPAPDTQSLTLSAQNITIEAGGQSVLIASSSPVKDESAYIWLSSNPDVVTAWNGRLQAISEGEAIVSVQSDMIVASCKVVVTPPASSKGSETLTGVQSVQVEPAYVVLRENELAPLTFTFAPEDAHDKRIVWHSSDESVASLTQGNRIKAQKAGVATLTGTLSNGMQTQVEVSVIGRSVPDGLKLDAQSKVLQAGEAFDLSLVSQTPPPALWASWQSSNANVAQVDLQGHVQALSPGVVDITAQLGAVTLSCRVVVLGKALERLVLAQTLTLRAGERLPVEVTRIPSDTTDKVLELFSGDESIMRIEDGSVYGVSPGESTLTARAPSGVQSTCRVVVTGEGIKPTALRFTLNKLALSPAEHKRLTLDFLPYNASDLRLSYTSSNEGVLKVDQGGLVTAYAPGEAIVEARTPNGLRAQCTISVDGIPVQHVQFVHRTVHLAPGQRDDAPLRVLPADATMGAIEVKSSNPDVAIYQDGQIVALREGKADIILQAGGRITACRVWVAHRPVQGMSFEKDSLSLYEGQLYTLKPKLALYRSAELTMSYFSSDKHVATVNDKGVITPHNAGDATIYLVGVAGAQTSLTLHVVEPKPTSLIVTPAQVVLSPSTSLALVASTQPAGLPVTFTSKNNEICQVSADGVLNAIMPGTTSILVRCGKMEKEIWVMVAQR